MQNLSKDDTKNIDELKNTAAENTAAEDDEWWMNYDSGVPSEDITSYLLEAKKSGKKK